MTVTFEKEFYDRHKCCTDNMRCCSDGSYQIIRDTKNRTRIYVFLGTPSSLVDLMDQMQTQMLFEKGEYIVIYVDMSTYSDQEAHKYLWKLDVLNNNRRCDKVPNLNFETSDLLTSFSYEKYVTIYAAYLFDAVKLYASALHHLLVQQPLLTDKVIDEVATNGTKIIETIIRINGTYKSIIGAMMKLDKNGDSEGNFSVIAFTEPDNQTVRQNFSCPFQMRPVGQFYQSDDENTFPQYEILNSKSPIQWPGPNKPQDEPSCGFDNELCPKPNTQLNSVIAAGALAVLLFCVGVFSMSVYRKLKIEQEIEGLLWKINREDIQNFFDAKDNLVSSPSRISLASASVTSYESRGGLQVFATTGLYRGVVVRIKELTFSRKKDISREVMKEMRLLRELRHDNVNSFIGAVVQPTSLYLVTDYCAKGSLYDIIENEDIKLDKMFIASLVHDLIKGMLYLHNSMLVCHGNLKSSNCVVTSRWVLQVTDFGLAEMRHCAENESIGEHQYYRSLFWKAPEILRNPSLYVKGTQKGDVYSFGIILYEMLGRRGPFGITGYEPKDIIELVKREVYEDEEPFRPDVDLLRDPDFQCDEYVLQCMQDCWVENPDMRPDFAAIRFRLKRMKDGKHKNIMDQMMDMMVKYAGNLEELVNERTRLLYEEKMKTEDLLHRMLPKPVAEKLTKGYGVEPESFDSVTIYFSDIVGFTAMSAQSTPLQVVNFLNDLYTVFDGIIKGYDVYKVETIGDAYMVVSGLPIKNGDRHAGEIASMALDLLAAVRNHTIAHRPKDKVELRIGIHTGPVVAGVVGLTMPRYCLFGDTVNTASRMESNGEPLKIHISHQCKDLLEKLGGYVIEERGLVNLKGKGQVRTFWLKGATEKAVQKREVDLNQLPALFSWPRRSPKSLESRQASVCCGGGHSRRHSSVPRDTGGSKLTVNTAFGSQLIDVMEERKPQRARRILSSIASSSDDPGTSQAALDGIRQSKSMDPLPFPVTAKTSGHSAGKYSKLPRRSTRSLENCDECGGDVQTVEKLLNNNFANGNALNVPQLVASPEDVRVPLLKAVRRRGGSAVGGMPDADLPTRWRSLEAVPALCNQDAQTKKSILKSWFVGLFNGNGLKTSNMSLKKAAMNEYNTLQPEKESIV